MPAVMRSERTSTARAGNLRCSEALTSVESPWSRCGTHVAVSAFVAVGTTDTRCDLADVHAGQAAADTDKEAIGPTSHQFNIH